MTKNKIQGPGNSGVQGFLDRIFFLFKSQFRNASPERLAMAGRQNPKSKDPYHATRNPHLVTRNL